MSAEPRLPGDLPGSTVGPEAGATSPLRVLFVVVPLLVVAAVVTNLFGLWTTSYQPAREKQVGHRQSEKDAVVAVDPVSKLPQSAEPRFDAAAVLALLEGASPDDGARLFRMCMPCHAGEKNGPHRIGSNLWNIVGSRKAAHPDFRYSAALKGKGGTWSYRELAEYLHNPRLFAPGTSMFFAGIADNRRMADLIAYLRTLSDNPKPLPK